MDERDVGKDFKLGIPFTGFWLFLIEVDGGERSTKTHPVTASAVCCAAFNVKLLSSIIDKDKPGTPPIETVPTWWDVRPDHRLEPKEESKRVDVRSKCGLNRPNNKEGEDEGPAVVDVELVELFKLSLSELESLFFPDVVEENDVLRDEDRIGKGDKFNKLLWLESKSKLELWVECKDDPTGPGPLDNIP